MEHSSHFRPPDERPVYEMNVYVEEMDEGSGTAGGVANFLSGFALYKGEKFHFEAVAYGRIGGQNVSPGLSDESVKRLQEMGVDLDSFISQLQRKLVEGDINVIIPEGTLPPSLDS